MAVTYFDHLRESMTALFEDPSVVGTGYNLRYGRAGGSLRDVSESQLEEMPLAENLMAGVAIGLSLTGSVPFLYFERMDFSILACDALVNHLSHMREISGGVHQPAAIIRCVVGNSKSPLFTGRTHTQNLSEAFRAMLTFPVIELRWKTQIAGAYEEALKWAKRGRSTMLVDFRDLHSS